MSDNLSKWERKGGFQSLAFEWAMNGDLSSDYRGHWSNTIQSALTSLEIAERSGKDEKKERALAILNKPRPTFEAYVRDEFPPEQQEQILSSPNLDWNQIREIDKLATEYNAIAQRGEITREIAKEFSLKSEMILRKKFD